jgi:predicted NUDIX family NTP pyrophosphohydrolase
MAMRGLWARNYHAIMSKRRSAGLLMYRICNGALEVLLAHPGGPLFAKKDDGHWTIPKGEYDDDDDALAAAQREFTEETSIQPRGPFIDLGEITQKGGKVVRAWAFAGECDPAAIASNTFKMEWPPRSGRTQSFPEVDRCDFFTLDEANRKIKEAQSPFIERLKATDLKKVD